MFFTDDPLEVWFMRDEVEQEARLAASRKESLAEMRAALDQLQEMLDHPPAKGANLMNSRVYGLGRWSIVRLPPQEASRAEELYRRVHTTGGPGSTYVQEGLLFIIGASRQPASIPFWLEALNLSRPRDSFAAKRRTMAIAALAYLAAHDCHEAEEALAQCARHANADIRAQAVFYWGEIYRAQQPLPQGMAEAMLAIAENDAAFSPRFQAREVLREMKLPVPFDNPHGVYACKVKFKGMKSIYRTIELRSDQTLEDLHLAIQQAMSWTTTTCIRST